MITNRGILHAFVDQSLYFVILAQDELSRDSERQNPPAVKEMAAF